jgi:DNA-binding NarL/FixJ family response regulator
MSYRYQSDVRLDTADARRPQLVVAVPLDQTDIIRDALAKLASSGAPGASAQEVILNALRTAAEQAYFWTPQWQEKERAADLAIAEGRVQTFDNIDDMVEFLDHQ